MCLTWCLDRTKMQFGGPGWRWDVTWMWVRCKYQDPDWGKIQLRQRRHVNLGAWVERRHKSRDLDGLRWDLDWVEMHILRRGWGDMGLGWSWYTIFQLTKGLDGGETHILKHVLVWADAWMELRCNLVDLDGGEMLPGCRRDVNIRSQIEVRFNWDKEET